MRQERTVIVLAAVERCRKRLWGHCYRMTGRRAEADDLSQEAIARAIERADAAASAWPPRSSLSTTRTGLTAQRRDEEPWRTVEHLSWPRSPSTPPRWWSKWGRAFLQRA